MLPTKLSELLELALNDFDKISKDPRYTINMGWYHYPSKETCIVCLAGCVMANTLGHPINSHVFPGDTGENYSQLRALDMLRCGHIHVAMDWVGNTNYGSVDDYRIVSIYRNDPATWRLDMDELLTYLKSKNL